MGGASGSDAIYDHVHGSDSDAELNSVANLDVRVDYDDQHNHVVEEQDFGTNYVCVEYRRD